jgi:hypothetical protein
MTDQTFSTIFANQPKLIENKKQKIITVGDATDRLLWVEQGKLRRTRDGRIYSTNDFVEILSFFGSDIYLSEIMSLTNTEIRVVPRLEVMRLFDLDKDPTLNHLVFLLAREKLSAEVFQFSQVG